MEVNVCDANHLDGEVLLPPRKRLLAGLKKQNSDAPSYVSSSPASTPSDRRLLAGLKKQNSDAPSYVSSSPASTPSEPDSHLNHLLSSHTDNHSLSPEEIAEASRSAAIIAAKAAEVARAAAEEKAAIAVKAVAAAKSALELVASLSEETSHKARYSKRNKLKKHVPVQQLYKKQKASENAKTDEELARKLHRVINSSPRISKYSPSSDVKSYKHKKPRISPMTERARVSNGGTAFEGDSYSMSNVKHVSGDAYSEGSSWEDPNVRIGEKNPEYQRSEIDNSEAGPSHSKEKSRETIEDSSSGRKRGRIKLKKLSLSNCSFRDQASPKEIKTRSSALKEENRGRNIGSRNAPLSRAESCSDATMLAESASMWKCQDLKSASCVKQNKVRQS